MTSPFSDRFAPTYKRIASTCILALLLLLAVFSMAAQARDKRAPNQPDNEQADGQDNEQVDEHSGPSWRGNPQVIVGGAGTVQAFWEDYRQWPQKSIYGNVRVGNWGAETRLFSGNAVALGPCAIDTAGSLYFTYRDSNGVPYFQKRPANGDWDTPETIPNDRLPNDLAVTGDGNAHLLFTPDVSGTVYALTRLADGTWKDQESVNPDASALRGVPTRLEKGADGVLYAVWGYRDGAGEEHIYRNRRSDTGEWDTPKRVDSALSAHALVGVDVSASTNDVHILWTSCDASNRCRLYYNQCDSEDCIEKQRVDNTASDGNFSHPRLVVDEMGNVYGLLSSYLVDSGLQKLYLTRRSTDGVWSELVELDSFESSASQYDLGQGGGFVTAVWNGWLGGNQGHAIWSHTWQAGYLPGYVADLTLTAQDIQAGQLYKQAGRFYLPLTATIHNTGTGVALGLQVQFAHGLPDQVAPIVADVTDLEIAAGDNTVIGYDWDVTDIMGRLDLVITADPNNQIYERVESNNQASVSLVADASPRLTHIKSSFKPGTFLQDIPLSNTFFVQVDWNGDLPGSGSPGYVTFALNGERTDVPVSVSDAWTTQDYDMGTQLQPGANFLRLSATSDAGRTSRVTVVELRGREAPAWLTGNTTVSAEPPAAPFEQVAVYQVKATWPPAAIDATFPVPETILPVIPGRFGTQLLPWSLALELRSDGRLGHVEGQGELVGYLADQPLIADARAQLDIAGNIALNKDRALALDALTATIHASQTLQTFRIPLISSSLPIFAQSALVLTVDGELGATEQADGSLDWITRNLELLADVNGVLATRGERLTHLEGGQGGQPRHLLQLSPGDTYTNNYTATLFAWARERAFIWDKTWEVTRTSAAVSTAQTGTLHTSALLPHAYLPTQAARSLAANALPSDVYPYADPALVSLADDDMTLVHVRQSGIAGLNLSAYRWDGAEWTEAGLVTQGSTLNVQPALAYAGQNPLLLWTRVVKETSDPNIDPHQILADTEIASVMYLPDDAHPPVAAFRSTSPDVIGEQTDFYNDTVPGLPTETRYTWDFGDDSPTSRLENPSHLYQDVGTFAVILTTTNVTGNDVATGTVTITCTPPSNLNWTHSAPVVSETMTFTGTCQSAPVPTYTWSFGDGQPGESGNPVTHTYHLTGNYTVQVTATNFCGHDTISRPLTVTLENQRAFWSPQTVAPFPATPSTVSASPSVPMSASTSATAPRARSDWVTMTRVTSNTVADLLPTARADVAGSGHVLAMWLRDPDNDYPLFIDETTRTLTVNVMAARWDGLSWSTPTRVLSDVNTREAPQFAYRGDEVVMAWSHDQDANPQTITDTAIHVAAWVSPTTWMTPTHWSAPLASATYHDDGPTQASVTPRAVFDADGRATVVWVRATMGGQDQLWYATYNHPTWTGPWAANWATDGIQGLKVLVTPDNNLIALWQARSASGMDLWYSIFDRAYSLWSTPRQLTDDALVEADYDAIVNSAGQALVVYAARSVTNTSRTIAGENVVYPTLSDSADIRQATSTAATKRDLTVTDLKVSPPNPAPGSTAVVSGTLVNSGSLTINPAYAVFRDNGDDVSIFYDAGPLAAGERVTFDFDWDVQDTGTSHTLTMLADPEDVISETDEANNVITLTTVLPDLHPAWHATDFSTTTITVTVGIRNIGVIANDAPFAVALRAGSQTGTRYASVAMPASLAAGAETFVTLVLNDVSAIPASATLSYALVDANGAVIEADERNNVALIDVPRRPDLTFGPYDLVSAPSQRLIVRNQGPVAASDAVVTVYRDVLGGAELLQATLTLLGPGDWVAVPLAGPPGPFSLAVYADPGNALVEGDESNNVLQGNATLWPRLYLPTVYKGGPSPGLY